MSRLRQGTVARVVANLIVGAGLLLASAGLSAVQAAEGFFIGDSIAAAAAQTIGMKGVARHSVSLRRNAIAPQFERVPKGAVAIMSLGLNDAAIPVQAMRKDIEMVIEGAQRTGERIVWMGPPCVMKSWDNRAKEMDDYLRQRLATTAIQYVSLRDPQICQPALRSRDGEHFTDAGYRYVWQKIQRDSTYAAEVVPPARVQFAHSAADARPRATAPRRPQRRQRSCCGDD